MLLYKRYPNTKKFWPLFEYLKIQILNNFFPNNWIRSTVMILTGASCTRRHFYTPPPTMPLKKEEKMLSKNQIVSLNVFSIIGTNRIQFMMCTRHHKSCTSALVQFLSLWISELFYTFAHFLILYHISRLWVLPWTHFLHFKTYFLVI